MRVFLVANGALVVALMLASHVMECARIHGWRSTLIDWCAAACIAVWLGSLAASGV